jgi:hypothetical protein
MSFGEKVEKSARKFLFPIVQKAGMGQIDDSVLAKIFEGYIKFMKWLFKVITMLTISTSLIWFFPVYVGLGIEKVILITLIIILLQLRYGKISVKID